MNQDSESIRVRKPWPTKAAMEQVYERNLWGGKSAFYSGEGSHNPTIVEPYIHAVTAFLSSFKEPISVCDLGCGDFNIGSRLVPYAKTYTAIDIVPDLIARNKKLYTSAQLEFQCLDISKADLPPADCAIIRQVLQHLSNAEVQHIIDKLYAYSYVLLTDHVPVGDFTPNKDIISGQGTRLKKQSGLDLLAPPFNFKPKDQQQLTAVVMEDGKSVIVTTLYKINQLITTSPAPIREA